MHEKETDLKNNVFESQESSLGAIGFCAVIRLPAAALAAEGRGEGGGGSFSSHNS